MTLGRGEDLGVGVEAGAAPADRASAKKSGRESGAGGGRGRRRPRPENSPTRPPANGEGAPKELANLEDR